MSETSQHPNNPENAPARIPNAPEAMQLENLDTLVGLKEKFRNDLRKQGADDSDENVDDIVKHVAYDHLTQNGYDLAEHSDEENDYAVAKLIEVMNLSEVEWLTTPDDADVQRRNSVHRELADHYSDTAVDESEEDDDAATDKDAANDDHEATNETIDELASETAAINMHFAELVAERSKRSFERAERTNTISNLREELSDMIGAVATEMMLVLEKEGMSEKRIADEIDKFIGEQMKLTVSEIESVRASDYEKRSPIVRRALDKWASWGEPKQKFLSKERFKGNFKKGLVFALPGAAIGAVVAPLVGAVAGSAIAGGLAIAGARSIGRHLMGARLDAAANAKSIALDQADKNREHIANNADAAHTELLDLFDKQSETYRKINRRRLIGGTAIAMTAGLVGGSLVQQMVHGNIGFGKAGDFFADRFGGKEAPASSPTPGSNIEGFVPKIPTNVLAEPSLGSHIDAFVPKIDASDIASHEHLIGQYVESHANGVKVNAGEGWNQTFKDFGISSKHHAELLKELGPQLQKMGVAYKDPTIGGWGITKSGELPDAAARLIAERASEHGWVDLGAATPVGPNVITDHAVEITKGGGIISEARDYGMDNLNTTQVNALGEALVKEGTGYKSDSLAGKYGIKFDANPTDATPAGRFTPGADSIFEDMADNGTLDQSVTEATLNSATTGVESQIHASDITDMVNSGDISKLNMIDQSYASDLAKSLEGVTYANGDPIVRMNYITGKWAFNDVPYGLTMPDEAKQQLLKFASKHNYDLAA